MCLEESRKWVQGGIQRRPVEFGWHRTSRGDRQVERHPFVIVTHNGTGNLISPGLEVDLHRSSRTLL